MMEPTPTRTPRARATITIAEVPMRVRMLPPSLQAAWVLNFNAKLKDGDSEQDAAVAAWAVVGLVQKELERQGGAGALPRLREAMRLRADVTTTQEGTMSKLEKMKTALGLPGTATLDEMRETFDRQLTEIADAELGDPRELLTELASTLAAERNITFTESLEQVKRARPDLLEAVGRLYASTRA